jgi:catechol 2,3-dioxygenase-like lactoylglutathione lyase family enzyme
MCAAPAIAKLGEVMQLAFVPDDFDAALAHWTKTIGAGPFFLLENVSLPNARYLGAPTGIVFTMALGYWGDMQIELIRPENGEPSHYRDLYGTGNGLHHVCILVDSIVEARAACTAANATVVFEADVGEAGGVIYADAGQGAGSLIELLQPQDGTRELFAMMRETHRTWDGQDAVRVLG